MLLAGMSPTEIVTGLRSSLRTLSGDDPKRRSSREKAITILFKTWIGPDEDLIPLRDVGLALLAEHPAPAHRGIHWGMIMAAYPFWGKVAAEVGRLLRLQGVVGTAQVRRRLIEHYGDREVVARATQTVLRSYVDWGVLKETSEKGIYAAGPSFVIDQVEVIAWLAEAFLHAHPDGSVPLRTILDSTSLFPFRLIPVSADHLVAVSGRLDVLRHGLDQDLIMLRSGS